MSKLWDDFNIFTGIVDKYMPSVGEGKTMASQICTAVNKLVYKWYNDGDVYDNTYYLAGWANDLSSYANWLSQNAEGTREILNEIKSAFNGSQYENILYKLAELCLNEDYLAPYVDQKAKGTIYNCEGVFDFSYTNYAEEDEYNDDF